MPRRPREDIYPIISIPEISSATKLASDAVGNPRVKLLVYYKENEYSWRYQILDEFNTHVALLRKEYRVNIDYGVLLYIAHRMELAKAIRIAPEHSEDGKLVQHVLRQCGCRARVTQAEIAEATGKSSATVSRAIQLLKDAFIIVNFGKGWYELDAKLFWRGNETIRQAYVKVQRIHPSIDIAFKS